MSNIIDITPELIAKQNKEAAKSVVTDFKGEAYYELMSLMAQLKSGK